MEKEKVNTTFLAKWFEGSITDAEFQQYVSENEFLHYQKLKKGVDAYAFLEKPVDDTFKVIREKIAKKKNYQLKHLYTKWAVSIAAGLVLFFGLFTLLKNDIEIIKTDRGEQKTIALLDGSTVLLNNDSTLRYDKSNWEDFRKVTLKGEAFFKVKKGSAFTVVTDEGTVQVLGTSFNVNSDTNFFEVTCFTGKVSVKTTTDSLPVILLPKDSYRKIGNAITSEKTPYKRPSWIEGESTFTKMPLKYVLSAFEKQYNIKFILDNVDDSVIFTGSFTHSNINIALESVFKTAGIRYKKTDKQTIVLSSGQ